MRQDDDFAVIEECLSGLAYAIGMILAAAIFGGFLGYAWGVL